MFYWIITAICRSYLFVFYRLRVYGSSHVSAGSAIIAPNHASFIDPPIIGASCPQEVHYLARDSLFKNRMMGWFIRKMNAHPVKRNARDLTSFKLIQELLAQGNKVVIFPEGVRTVHGSLGEFKVGAALLALRSRCEIIPVYIHGSYEVWPRRKKFPKLFGKLACVFGTPVSCKEFEAMEKKEGQEAMTARVKESIERLKGWYLEGAAGEPP